MAEEVTMQNIDIADFTEVSGLNSTDYVLLVVNNNNNLVHGKIKVALYRKSVENSVTPSIKDGYWWIGSVETGVMAEGLTPEFKKGELGIYTKYTTEDDTAWRLVVNFTDITWKFEDLTDEQRQMLIPHLSDLTEEEIAELQQPATEMIAKLEATNTSIENAEDKRVAAENTRVSNENLRLSNETDRQSNENTRQANEETRISNETLRISNEDSRKASEQTRQSNEDTRKTNEANRESTEADRDKAESIRQSNENNREKAEENRDSNEQARIANEKVRVQQEAARVTAEEGRVSEFARLKEESEESTDYANEVATHPTYVGTDNYVYVWDHASQAYNKTYILVKAGGLTIDVQYTSVAELETDEKAYNDGLFALVNTGDVDDPENAMLYIRKNGAWDFLVDMSGAIGLTGKTPQLFVGTVALGKNRNDYGVSLSYAGEDENGNPMYNVNYVVPALSYDDLTEEDIAELQRPATEMIAKLQATNDSVKEAEALRVTAEEGRVAAEEARVTAENGRVTAEEGRVTEFARLKEESENATESANKAATSANTATDAANTAATNADTATSKANESADNADAATERANQAAKGVEEATEKANAAAEKANTAADGVEEVTEKANAATTSATAAATSASNAASSANTAADKANTAATSATTAATSANTAKTECANATSAAYASAQTAEEKIVEMESIMENFSVEAQSAPVKLEVEYPKTISIKNTVEQSITPTLYPTYVMQNVVYQWFDGDSLRCRADGTLKVKELGETTFYVIPTQNTALAQEVTITVRNPRMRLNNGKIRLNGMKIRIV